MHEVSIAESIIDIAIDYAQREDVSLFSAIELEIGVLSGIEIDALTFAMDVVCRNTVLDGAEIRITTVPGRSRCATCNMEFDVDDHYTPCPGCGDVRSTVIRGDELRVASLIVNV